MNYDAIIIGGGPAAVSAALTLRARNKTTAVVTGGVDDIPLSRSHKIANYPGMPDVSGRDMLLTMEAQAADAGAEIIRGRATSVLNMGDSFGVAVGNALDSVKEAADLIVRDNNHAPISEMIEYIRKM